MAAEPRLAGYRNVILIESFLAWSAVVLWFMKPPTGYTPEVIYAIGVLILYMGGVVVAALTARAANKIADRWEPGAFRRERSP